MFQKRHYEFLAQFMARERPNESVFPVSHDTWCILRDEMATALRDEARRSGVNFKPAMFVAACNKDT